MSQLTLTNQYQPYQRSSTQRLSRQAKAPSKGTFRTLNDQVKFGSESTQSPASALGEFVTGIFNDLFGSSNENAAVQPQIEEFAGTNGTFMPGNRNQPQVEEFSGLGPSNLNSATDASPEIQQSTSNMGMGGDLLRMGMSGPEVKSLQELLNAQGFQLEIDGKFGPKTLSALKEFQAKQANNGNPIKVDGIVGPETSGALSRTAQANEFSSIVGSNNSTQQANEFADLKTKKPTTQSAKSVWT